MDRAVEGMDRSFGAWSMPDEYREMQRLVRRFVQGDVRAVEDTLPHDATSCPPTSWRPCRRRPRPWGSGACAPPRPMAAPG